MMHGMNYTVVIVTIVFSAQNGHLVDFIEFARILII
jgi:hypothetical protein